MSVATVSPFALEPAHTVRIGTGATTTPVVDYVSGIKENYKNLYTFIETSLSPTIETTVLGTEPTEPVPASLKPKPSEREQETTSSELEQETTSSELKQETTSSEPEQETTSSELEQITTSSEPGQEASSLELEQVTTSSEPGQEASSTELEQEVSSSEPEQKTITTRATETTVETIELPSSLSDAATVKTSDAGVLSDKVLSNMVSLSRLSFAPTAKHTDLHPYSSNILKKPEPFKYKTKISYMKPTILPNVIKTTTQAIPNNNSKTSKVHPTLKPEHVKQLPIINTVQRSPNRFLPDFKYNWPLLVDYPVHMKPIQIGSSGVFSPLNSLLYKLEYKHQGDIVVSPGTYQCNSINDRYLTADLKLNSVPYKMIVRRLNIYLTF